MPSLQPTPKTFRKICTVRGSIVPDENEIFRKPDEIKCFANLTENLYSEKVTCYKVDV